MFCQTVLGLQTELRAHVLPVVCAPESHLCCGDGQKSDCDQTSDELEGGIRGAVARLRGVNASDPLPKDRVRWTVYVGDTWFLQ